MTDQGAVTPAVLGVAVLLGMALMVLIETACIWLGRRLRARSDRRRWR